VRTDVAALFVVTLLAGCDNRAPTQSLPVASNQPAPPTTAAPASVVDVKTRYLAVDRVVALGDVHGDIAATRKALKLGGLIDDDDNWVGGDTTLVQTGDVLDRGNDEQAIIDLLVRLQEQAADNGGHVHLLHGNHELMNVAGDFRYVTAAGMTDFADAPGVDMSSPRMMRMPVSQRARAAAFFPGSAYATKLASHPVVVIVGDTVYCHGGVLPKHAAELDRLNREVSAWLLGSSRVGAMVVAQTDSPVWSRHYSDQPDEADCKLLDETLRLLGVKRMVVGHTVQRRINPACGGKVWRIDVGMSAHYGGSPQVLELTKEGARPIHN
jgi:hypothetical protein